MRLLSESQAKRCEQAKTPRCKCRCAGRFHGAQRAADVRTLPVDDPHRPADPRERRRRRPGPVERDEQRVFADLDRQLDSVDAMLIPKDFRWRGSMRPGPYAKFDPHTQRGPLWTSRLRLVLEQDPELEPFAIAERFGLSEKKAAQVRWHLRAGARRFL